MDPEVVSLVWYIVLILASGSPFPRQTPFIIVILLMLAFFAYVGMEE